MATMDNFVGKVVGLVVAVVVIAMVAIPIINGMVGTDGTPEGATYPIQANSPVAPIIEVLPVFLVLAILIMIVKMFLDSRAE